MLNLKNKLKNIQFNKRTNKDKEIWMNIKYLLFYKFYHTNNDKSSLVLVYILKNRDEMKNGLFC